MDSLEALPSADYASLLIVSLPNEETKVPKDDLDFTKDKSVQEHIYDQVTPRKQEDEPQNTKTESEKRNKQVKKCAYNTYVLKNSTVLLNHAKSTPDFRNTYTDLPSLLPKKFDSLNAASDKKSLKTTSDLDVDSSVFSISGRRVIVSSGFIGNKGAEGRGHASSQSKVSPSPWSRSPSADGQLDAKRRKLQVCTDCFSLCLFVPGTLLCILSPWLLVPIYMIPNFSGSHFQILVWILCVGSTLLVFMGCMVGNMVWYRKGQNWKCLLHCGKGPRNHYWGNSLSSRTLHIV